MKKRKGAAQQLPYADRLRMKKQAELQEHSAQAVQTALKLACIALNDTEGLGFLRLTRFAQHLLEQADEYYSDPELKEYQINRRLEQMGFVITDTGGVQAMQDGNGNPVKKEAGQ